MIHDCKEYALRRDIFFNKEIIRGDRKKFWCIEWLESFDKLKRLNREFN